MPIKDYYQILDLQPGADAQSIRKAFRKLAMVHHPDKLPREASYGYFQEIQQAYAVLIDPVQKEHYLQERWLEKSQGKSFDTARDPYQLLAHFLEIEREVAQWEKNRNGTTIASFLMALFSPERIAQIQSAQENELTRQAALCAFRISASLDYATSRKLMEHISNLLKTHPDTEDAWIQDLYSKKTREQWKERKIGIIAILTIVICLFMFVMTRR